MPANNAAEPAYRHPTGPDLTLDPATMPALFGQMAAARPRAPLVHFLGRTYSYAALWEEALGFAAGLRARGIGAGDRVGLFLPNVPIYLSAYYGTMLAGAVAVNYSPLYSVDELRHQAEDSGTRLLVTLDVPALLPTALAVLDGSAVETVVVGRLHEQLPFAKGALLRAFGRSKRSPLPARADVVAFRALLAEGDTAPFADPAPADLALLQYTGGTTGRPKGAMLSHANLAANARQVAALEPWGADQRDVIMGALPLFHVFANTCVLNRTVVCGGAIAMIPRFDATEVLQTLRDARVTAFPGVPTMYQALLDHPAISRVDLAALRICVSGGAPLPAVLKTRFEAATGARLVEGYGLTESAGVVSTNRYETGDRPGTIGQPLPGTRVRLVDKADPAAPPPAGEPGELVIRGPQIMDGYWNRPDAAADAFTVLDGERWLRTGDVAEIDADGFVRIVDRLKDMIAVGGFKVFPSEVERVILEHPAVREALVIGVPDDYLGERPMAYVSLREPADAGDLEGWANARLGKHERVAGVAIRADLPKTLIGKLDRKALRAQELGEATALG